MRTRRRIGRPWSWGLALVVVVLGQATARAQGVFPDIYIKRQRPCCAAEDPRYRVIREQYYGYFPTCWRRFPPGWGCPSPDAPNWEAAKAELPLSPLEALPGGGEVGEPGVRRGGGEPGRGTPPELPPIPDEDSRDLFQDNLQPPANPPLNEPAPRDLFDIPGGGASASPAAPTGAPILGTPPGPADAPSDPNATGANEIPAAAPSVPTIGSSEPFPAPGLTPPGDLGAGAPEIGLDLSGDLPSAPPLAPPSAMAPGGLPPGTFPGPIAPGTPEFGRPIPGPISGGPTEFGQPIPGPEPIPAPTASARAPRRGPIANLLGRMRKR
jgi:hypothetical protein